MTGEKPYGPGTPEHDKLFNALFSAISMIDRIGTIKTLEVAFEIGSVGDLISQYSEMENIVNEYHPQRVESRGESQITGSKLHLVQQYLRNVAQAVDQDLLDMSCGSTTYNEDINYRAAIQTDLKSLVSGSSKAKALAKYHFEHALELAYQLLQLHQKRHVSDKEQPSSNIHAQDKVS